MVDGGQQDNVEPLVAQHGLKELKVNRAHLRSEDRIALSLHLLGVSNFLERRRGRLAVNGDATRQVGRAGMLKRSIRAMYADRPLL